MSANLCWSDQPFSQGRFGSITAKFTVETTKSRQHQCGNVSSITELQPIDANGDGPEQSLCTVATCSFGIAFSATAGTSWWALPP